MAFSGSCSTSVLGCCCRLTFVISPSFVNPIACKASQGYTTSARRLVGGTRMSQIGDHRRKGTTAVIILRLIVSDTCMALFPSSRC